MNVRLYVWQRTTAALMASEDESRVRIAEFLNRKRS